MFKIKGIAILLTKYSALFKAILYKKRFFNTFLILFSYIRGKNNVLGSPFLLQVEPTNRCNLSCDLCLTGLGKLSRPKRDMTFQEFTQIINQFEESIIYLVLYNLGEPLLNTQIYEMIEYAKEKKVFIQLSTNGYFNDDKHIKRIINCGVDELIISLDFTTPESYTKHKKSKTFENVVENILLIVKERGRKRRPFINVQLLLMRDNEEEIPRFKSLIHYLKVDKGIIKKVRVDFPGSSPDVSFLPQNSKHIRKSYMGNYKRAKCYRPWISTVILSDNSIVPCCFDMHSEYNFGNISNLSFSQIWNNEKYVRFRKQILNNINQIPLCKQCSIDNFFDNFVK